MTGAYPLRWPAGWPRSSSRRPAAFERSRTLAQARTFLLAELRLANASPLSICISTNVPLRADGLPRSGEAQPADRGVAVYFTRQGVELVTACDRWDRVEDNLYAIAKDINAVRARQRWGVSSIERALAGHHMLPASKSPILLSPASTCPTEDGHETP